MKIIETAPSYSEQFSDPFLKEKLTLSIGLCMDGKMHWLQSGNEMLLAGQGISIRMKKKEIHSKIRFTKFYVSNHFQQKRNIKLFIAHRHTYPTRNHISFISPLENIIYHIAENQMFLVNGHMNGKFMKECTVHPYWNVSTDNIWTENKQSVLQYMPMVKGNAVSIYAHEVEFTGKETLEGETWFISDSSKKQLIEVNESLLKNILAIQTEK
ncbi:hypothetical protein ACUXCC_003838 [Cytobacillus horneckiae]|uniref:Uncharacterized protein n=1 Tax=Cytobacillus horneckiae TaxID=549687 RepID=A0A2N0ZHA8_9BACI|nr:hypothetical protein [Cytobacillus horneckiae]MBN6888869.1 hypothetical protein [Cytobacillus horneckiae]MCM3179950.1 hypothetical protein [Cytobacillus horneckiae]MEC1155339.1 hypothetical protein [Cytobacillus horneckiae]MED2936608.1 hypothetical protein [Cytobacillus horneckiae]PKG28900.1 hypothetical protein CWS20_11135 [Cytobacillus horneckiae]